MVCNINTEEQLGYIQDIVSKHEERLGQLQENLEKKQILLYEITEELSECVEKWYLENISEENGYDLNNIVATIKNYKMTIEDGIRQLNSEIRFERLLICQLNGQTLDEKIYSDL
jgi:hypothetical protein